MIFRFNIRRATNTLRRGIFSRTTLHTTLAITIGVVAAVLLPFLFGEDFATRKAAKLYAPLAGIAYGSGSREDITVALVDDATLRNDGKIWPPNYGYYARLLHNIGLYKPRAIFFDIVLRDYRENDKSVNALVDTVCALTRSGVPVYLAGEPGETGSLAIIPPLQKVEGKCLELVDATYTADSLDREVWEYPLEYRSNQSTKPVRSAAMAIYEGVTGQVLPRPAERMALTWGLSPVNDDLNWLSTAAAAETDRGTTSDFGRHTKNKYCRSDYGVKELLPQGILRNRYPDAEKPVCVFHHTVYIDQLRGTDASDAQTKARLQNKIVLLGTARRFGGDYINSPISDRIPGAYLHAMALDNLLTYGSDYKRVASFSGKPNADTFRLFVLTIISLATVILIRLIKNAYRHTRRNKENTSSGGHLFTSNVSIIETTPGKSSEPRPLLMVWLPAYDDGRWIRVSRVWTKAVETFKWILDSLLGVLIVIAVVEGTLVLGQHALNIGFFSVIDVVVFALAAEWFEWNERILEWWSIRSEGENK